MTTYDIIHIIDVFEESPNYFRQLIHYLHHVIKYFAIFVESLGNYIALLIIM